MERLYKHPRIIVAVIAIVTVFFAFQLPKAKLDNNNFRFVPEKDPARLQSARIDDTFGSQILILVGLERKYGSVLDADFIKHIRDFGKKVKDIQVVGDVTSLVTTDFIGGSSDGITVEPLVNEDFSGTDEEVAALRDRLMAWDLYRNALVSDDFTATQILVSLDLNSEEAGSDVASEAYEKIRDLAYAEGFKDTRIYLTGTPVFSAVVNESTHADLVMLIPLVVLVVLSVLFFSFRRAGGIILPLLTVLVATVWAIGLMALLGVKLSIISTVLPVILVAVGSAYGIHVMSHYYDEVASKGPLDAETHRVLLLALMKKVGRPVMLAALTTFAGFGSLAFTSVVPISEFGVFSSFGVIVSFVVSVLLIPSLYLIRGPSKAKGAQATSGTALAGVPREDRLSGAIADAFDSIARKPRSTLFFAALAVALSLWGISKLVIDNVLVEYFKYDNDVVASDSFIRSHFGGSKSVSVVVRGKEKGDVLDPAVLGAMDGLASYLEKNVPEVGKTTGFTDMIKRINQVFNADESPEGLKATSPSASDGGGDSGFGFGALDGDSSTAVASFGFGGDSGEDAGDAAAGGDVAAFGFSGAEASSSVPSSQELSTPSTTGAGKDEELLSGMMMVQLLQSAIAAEGNRNLSADELVSSLARKYNYRGASYYEIPTDPKKYGKKDASELRALISNYLVLLSGNISSFADDPLEPRSIRMNVQLRTVGQHDTDRAIKAMEEYVAAQFPKNVEVEIGGVALVEGALNKLVVQSQLISVGLSLLMVIIILSVYYRSILAGLIGLAPLAISVLINFGVMGLTGIKLNIGTAMVASVAVGIGIDYTIHYLAAYHHEFLLSAKGSGIGVGNAFRRRTFLTSGKAILLNAVSVGAGFAVLSFSQFNILSYLGALIALTMGTSAIVSLTVLPVLLDLIKPTFIRRPLPFDAAELPMEGTK